MPSRPYLDWYLYDDVSNWGFDPIDHPLLARRHMILYPQPPPYNRDFEAWPTAVTPRFSRSGRCRNESHVCRSSSLPEPVFACQRRPWRMRLTPP